MPSDRKPLEPRKSTPREITIRQEMIELLAGMELTTRELSRLLGIREKEVADHLGHIGRSVASRGLVLKTEPSRCLSCGYLFPGRRRLTKPGRCPKCRESHIEPPAYRLL